ncbi:MAG: hypothetical protein M0C28_06990 [Candidatus Moduliflexus flocculans]|nr:hypothetical protein [Candidatus Moduliflexus flocculans]
MRKTVLALLVLTVSLPFLAGARSGRRRRTQPAFDEYFLDKALRVDLFQTGDAKDERVTVHQIYEEGIWPESKAGLLPPFDQGRYVLKVYDAASNRLVFLRGFDTMYAEYKTTSPALAGEVRVFERSVRFPLPKRPVLFVVEKRDKRNLLHPDLRPDHRPGRLPHHPGDARVGGRGLRGPGHGRSPRQGRLRLRGRGLHGRRQGQVQGRRRPDDGVPASASSPTSP